MSKSTTKSTATEIYLTEVELDAIYAAFQTIERHWIDAGFFAPLSTELKSSVIDGAVTAVEWRFRGLVINKDQPLETIVVIKPSKISGYVVYVKGRSAGTTKTRTKLDGAIEAAVVMAEIAEEFAALIPADEQADEQADEVEVDATYSPLPAKLRMLTERQAELYIEAEAGDEGSQATVAAEARKVLEPGQVRKRVQGRNPMTVVEVSDEGFVVVDVAGKAKRKHVWWMLATEIVEAA